MANRFTDFLMDKGLLRQAAQQGGPQAAPPQGVQSNPSMGGGVDMEKLARDSATAQDEVKRRAAAQAAATAIENAQASVRGAGPLSPGPGAPFPTPAQAGFVPRRYPVIQGQ